ncbi:MAG: hypothetical protein ACR2QW_20370 [bacterium]
MKPAAIAQEAAMRPPDKVMKLARMGCFHQSRLSFMRALLRQLKRDRWEFKRSKWELDQNGVGVAVYYAKGPERDYSLVCFSHDLPPDKRSDRVIADQWDATFVLCDGVPSDLDITRLHGEVPRQEAGRCSHTELVLSRANRSVRLFDHVVERLAQGLQPEVDKIDQVGYLMRTTAVYGNGKFGLSDRERIADRSEFSNSFRAELLAVWLIRWFTVDVAEHMAAIRNPGEAVAMDPQIRRRLGVGNSTGLGMAPFLVTHPSLLHTWINARETALLRVCGLSMASVEAAQYFRRILDRMRISLRSWHTADERQTERIEDLKQDLETLEQHIKSGAMDMSYPWNELVSWSETALSVEGQELLVSMIIEPHGELVDDLAEQMAIDETGYQAIDGSITVAETLMQLKLHYQWAVDTDFNDPAACARFWYVSEEKLEPRLGVRAEEPGAEKEQPLAFARDVKSYYTQLLTSPVNDSLARFLMTYPEHRSAARRVQLAEKLPYAEIRDNLVGSKMIPIDLLRCKLSFFGANKFDPRSDRWVRITMYQDAPFPDEFDSVDPDDWIFPQL